MLTLLLPNYMALALLPAGMTLGCAASVMLVTATAGVPPVPPPASPPLPPRDPPHPPPPTLPQRCAGSQTMFYPMPQPELHFVCRRFAGEACCSAAAAADMIENDIVPRGLEPMCWAPFAAYKCAIACDPDAANWDWIDFMGGTPIMCTDFCMTYYASCLAEGLDRPYGIYANATYYCNDRGADTNCLSVPASPPLVPPNPPPSPEPPPGSPHAPPPLFVEASMDTPNWVLIFGCMVGVLAICCAFAGLRMRVDKWLNQKALQQQAQAGMYPAAAEGSCNMPYPPQCPPYGDPYAQQEQQPYGGWPAGNLPVPTAMPGYGMHGAGLPQHTVLGQPLGSGLGGDTPRGNTPRGGGGGGHTPRGSGGGRTPRGSAHSPRVQQLEPDFVIAARAATPREHRLRPLPPHLDNPYHDPMHGVQTGMPVGGGSGTHRGSAGGGGGAWPGMHGVVPGGDAEPFDEDYEMWPDMDGAQSHRGGAQSHRGGAPSHRGGAPSHRDLQQQQQQQQQQQVYPDVLPGYHQDEYGYEMQSTQQRL